MPGTSAAGRGSPNAHGLCDEIGDPGGCEISRDDEGCVLGAYPRGVVGGDVGSGEATQVSAAIQSEVLKPHNLRCLRLIGKGHWLVFAIETEAT